MGIRKIAMAVATGALMAAGSAASGQLVLQDLGSTAEFDLASQAGQHTWLVDGVDHMFQQWFWFRAGSDLFERSIDTIPHVGTFVTDTNPFVDVRPDTFDSLWRDGRFDLEVNVTLRGATAGSGRSDLAEQIRITNTTNQVLPFSFFQYVDLDLNNTVPDGLVQITGGNTAYQVDELGTYVGETVLTPLPSQYQVNLFSTTRDNLNDAGLTNLGLVGGPLGPGDVTWAFQWDFNILPGQSVLISKDKNILPAPGSAALLALGGLALARRRRHA